MESCPMATADCDSNCRFFETEMDGFRCLYPRTGITAKERANHIVARLVGPNWRREVRATVTFDPVNLRNEIFAVIAAHANDYCTHRGVKNE